jgi:hypothetical protein
MRNVYEILVGKAERWRPLGRPRVDGRIILHCVLEKYKEPGQLSQYSD